MSCQVLSLVQRGWHGARECSLRLATDHIKVLHLIKGTLTPEVREMIASSPHIRLVDVHRNLFRCWMWAILITQSLNRRLHWVLIDHERTAQELAWWCRCLRLVPVMVRQTGQGYELYVNGQPTSFEQVFHSSHTAAHRLEVAS